MPRGPVLGLTEAPAPRTPAAQRGMVPEQLLVSDRQVIRLQVWGKKHPLCPRPVPATPGPPLPPCLGALGVCLVSWPGASGPTRHLGDASHRPGPPAAPAYLRGRRGLLAHTCSGSPGGFSPPGQGKGLQRPPSSAWDGAPNRCLSRGSACDSRALLSGAEPGGGSDGAGTRRGWAGAEPDRAQRGRRPREGQPLVEGCTANQGPTQGGTGGETGVGGS